MCWLMPQEQIHSTDRPHACIPGLPWSCRFQIYREVQLHARLQHQNVITLFGAFQQDNQVSATAGGHLNHGFMRTWGGWLDIMQLRRGVVLGLQVVRRLLVQLPRWVLH